MAPRIAERIIAVGGGKGGVGKSVIAANLSIALAQSGRRVVLVDGDLGAANLHTLFGVERPGPTLEALFTRQIASLEEALVPTAVAGLRLLPGSSGQVGGANINHAQKAKLLRQIRSLDAEVIVLDVGAGVSFNTLDLFDLSDLRLVVTTPQLTAVQNAYSFLKGALYRALRPLAEGPEETALLEAAAGGATERMEVLLNRAGAQAPAFRARLEEALRGFRALLVGNLVHQRAERNIFHAVSRMVHDFLGLDAPVRAVLWNERTLHDSVNDRAPLLQSGSDTEAAKALRKMAADLLALPLGAARPEAAEQSEDAPPQRPAPPGVFSKPALAVALTEAARGLPASQSLLTVPPPSEPALPATAPQAAPDAPPVSELAASIAARERRYQRYPAGWSATLLGNGASFAVHVREVSFAGALLDSPQPLVVDSEWNLLFDHLPEAGAVPVVIRTARGEGKRSGAQFMPKSGQLPAALGAAILSLGKEG
jgi:flagellar biosynthesis protein FlhG